MRDGINRCGTRKEYVVQPVELAGEEKFIAFDDKGVYITEARHIDSGIADINRYGRDRDVFIEQLETAGVDMDEVTTKIDEIIANMPADTGKKKKVNPLKASKRGARGR